MNYKRKFICFMLVFSLFFGIILPINSETIFASTKIRTPKFSTIQQISKNKLKLSWKKVSGASGYIVQIKENGKWKTLKNTSKKTHVVSGLETGKTYLFRVKAYKKIGNKKVWSKYSNVKKVKVQTSIYLVNQYVPYNNSSYIEYKNGKTFYMGGKKQKNGFTMGQNGVGVDKFAIFNIEGKYSNLFFNIGKVDEAFNHPYDGDLDVKVYTDGVLIDTITIDIEALPKSVNIPLNYAKQLKIEVETDACTIVGFSNVKLIY